jgi:small multidrug resistance pump
VSVAYPVWAEAGTAGVALFGVLAPREPASVGQVIGVALVVAGIVLLNLGSAA